MLVLPYCGHQHWMKSPCADPTYHCCMWLLHEVAECTWNWMLGHCWGSLTTTNIGQDCPQPTAPWFCCLAAYFSFTKDKVQLLKGRVSEYMPHACASSGGAHVCTLFGSQCLLCQGKPSYIAHAPGFGGGETPTSHLPQQQVCRGALVEHLAWKVLHSPSGRPHSFLNSRLLWSAGDIWSWCAWRGRRGPWAVLPQH